MPDTELNLNGGNTEITNVRNASVEWRMGENKEKQAGEIDDGKYEEESLKSLLHKNGVQNKKAKIVQCKSQQTSEKLNQEEFDTENKSGIFGLFRYASKGDILLLFIGTLFAIIHGASFPILAVVFGQMTNTFILQATKGFYVPNLDTDFSNNTNFSEDSNVNTTLDFVKLQADILSTVTSNISSTYEERSLTVDEFTDYMQRFSMYYLCIGLGVLTAAFVQTVCWELAAERQVYRLHQIFFSQILRQDISWYDTNENGDLTTKLSDDLERIREGIGSKFSMVTQYVSTFFSGIAVGLYANWKLTCIVLLMGPILISTSGYMARTASSSAAREQLKYSIAGGVAEEVLNAVRTVVAFGGEIKETKRYEKALDEGRKLAMKKYYVLSVGIALVFFVTYASFGVAFWYGAKLIGEGVSTPGSVFTVFFSVMSGAYSLGNALPFVNAVSTAVGAASTIFNIIDRVPNIDPYSSEGMKPKHTNGHIKFKSVNFSYPARPEVEVLKGLDLEILSGKTIALVGPSGSGKSTVISLLMRFYNPTSGEITLDGRSIRHINLSWLREQIGIVSQEPILFGVSIADNIRYGSDGNITKDEMINAAKLANAHSFISSLPKGYDTMVGDHGAQLSGGQKQRIAIARAVVRNPRILLLDEATSALDAHSEGIVQEALEHAMKGRTTVIVAHRLSTIRNADIIYVFKDGVVGESGTYNSLMMKQGLFYNLVTTQIKSEEERALPTPLEESPDNEGKLKRLISKEENSKSSLYVFSDDKRKEKGELAEKEKKQCGSMMIRLLKLNSPEWLCLMFGIFGCALSGATMPIFAFFYGEVFSTFTLTGDKLRSTAIFWTAMFFVLAFLSGTSLWLQVVCMSSSAEKLVARMRLMAFENILRQTVGWFDMDDNSSGKLIAKLARDAPMIKNAAGLRAGNLVSAGVTLVAAIVIAFLYGWKLASVLLIGVPLIAGATYQQTLILRRHQQRDMKLADNAGKVASECVSNIRTVQALGKEKLFLKLYTNFLELPFREAKKQVLVYSCVFSFSQAVIFVMYAVAFRYGAHLIQSGQMTPTDVYRVFFALAFCASAVGQTSAYVRDYGKAKLSAQSLFKLIEKKSEINVNSPMGAKPDFEGNVSFNDVHFRYPSRPDVKVLKGLSFNVEPGKTLALVGVSGCGKSTVVSLLERFYDPLHGSVMIDGIDIRTINVAYLRKNIGLVTQEPVLFNCSIKENIAYGIDPEEGSTAVVPMDDIIKAAVAANIHNFIVNLPQGYETPVGEGGSKLSGGQKQRVAIARALIRDPKILLLDEATSALDTESEKVVQDALDHAREGRTCIIIAHRLSTIQNADMIAVIQHGQVVEQGTHEDLKNQQGLYYDLIKRQNF